jgi:hypothetical protein
MAGAAGSEKQVPHRRFAPVRNDKGLFLVWGLFLFSVCFGLGFVFGWLGAKS